MRTVKYTLFVLLVVTAASMDSSKLGYEVLDKIVYNPKILDKGAYWFESFADELLFVIHDLC